MNCRSAESLFSSFVEDELSQKERRALEGHLDGCDRCARSVEELRATVDLMSALPSYETGPAFEEEVMDRIRSGEALRPSLIEWISEFVTPSRLRPAFLAGATGCALWIAMLLVNPADQGTKGTSTIASKTPSTAGSTATPVPSANVAEAPVPTVEMIASSSPVSRVSRATARPALSPTLDATASNTGAADSARANPNGAPYQDEYILDQFYLNRSGEDGVHSIVPVTGRPTDDVYIVF